MIRFWLSIGIIFFMVGAGLAGEWDPKNFTALWKACEKRSPTLYFQEFDKLEDKFWDEVKKQPRTSEYGIFANKEFRETVYALFPFILPDDYPFRNFHLDCWMHLRSVNKRLENGNVIGAREWASRWHACMGSGWRDAVPPAGRKLEQCFIDLRVLAKENLGTTGRFQKEKKAGPKGGWNAKNFTALWKACDKGSFSEFAEELDDLEDMFMVQVEDEPRTTDYGSFIDNDFAETGQILFPDLLPDNYPFRTIWKACWPPLLFLRRQIEEDASARPRQEAEEWQSCISLGYRTKPPLVAKKLEQCFIKLGLLDKKK